MTRNVVRLKFFRPDPPWKSSPAKLNHRHRAEPRSTPHYQVRCKHSPLDSMLVSRRESVSWRRVYKEVNGVIRWKCWRVEF